ncbi:MAG TPA: sugar ABC transporter permease [Candidatus Ozemobacteraceae bacterium]|nr:sugar ABC transporter permease [Candidatus Ozemobacteraceae bacterium]HQG28699.1 sugar ABC transporter permease [Candidatus Ozemobacteraceae bacterium]
MLNKKKIDWGAYCYLVPVFGILLCFHVLPIFYSLAISFYRWDLIGEAEWVGLDNFARLFDDPMFYKSLVNTFYYAIVSVPLSIACSMSIALLLNNPISGIGIYRTIYFLPVITSLNAVSIVWNFIYHPDYGLLNKLLALVNLPPQLWLQDPFWAMPCIILMSVWKGLGYNVVIFLAGLQNIPKHLYEAARIDGANWLQQFRHITFPLLSPTTFFVFVMSTIGSFQVFSQIYMMTPRGGPLKSTMVIVYYLYQKAFEKFEFGYALAIAFVLFIMIFSMTLFNKLYVEKKVHYS